MLAVQLRVLGIAEQAQEMFAKFPQLARAAEALAWHLSDRILFQLPWPMQSKTPLITCCLQDAFQWMWYHAGLPERKDERDLQTAFLAGLMFHVPEIIHVAVRYEGSRWDFFNDEPLGEWLPRRPGATFGAPTREELDELLSMKDQQIRGKILDHVLGGGIGELDVRLAHVLLPPDSFRPPRA